MKNFLFVFFAFAIIFCVFSCKKGPEPAKKQSKTIVVLIDYSESAKNARQDYADSFDKILSKTNPGDHLFVWKITELSEMESKPLIDENFPFPKNATNDFYKRQEIVKAQKIAIEKKENIKRKIQDILSLKEQLSMRTAILGSLQVAERVFKTDKKDKSVLIVLSDMVEDSSEYNFEKDALAQKRIDEIIIEETNKGRIPDLRGVKVYAVGARSNSRNQYYRIRDFWLKYFKDCGANLEKENYGSTLINFNE